MFTRVRPQFNGRQWTVTIPLHLANQMELRKGELLEISINGDPNDPVITMRRVRE